MAEIVWHPVVNPDSLVERCKANATFEELMRVRNTLEKQSLRAEANTEFRYQCLVAVHALDVIIKSW